MAGRIQGITVEIGGDTTKLQKALQGAIPSISHIAGQCPWAVSGSSGQKVRARVAVRAVYTPYRQHQPALHSPDSQRQSESSHRVWRKA